jgi:enoyl-[acyl-carrier protein] reductase/trans-2-enoyl-CoA reductase (NAD+)
MALELFAKLPLGGLDRRALVGVLASQGPTVARDDLAKTRASITRQDAGIRAGACVLLLGGSNGILRSLAIQLLFAERVPVFAVHYDSEKLQVGPHHARAITEAANDIGVDATFVNADATAPSTIESVVAQLKSRYRCVHLVNGIAAGAPKRYEKYGPTQVPDLDVAFDPVRQIPDFSSWEKVRKVGLVQVEVATEQDIERTNKFMGRSTDPWADALAAAGLLVKGESLVAFADYDFEPTDPVYAMGPLAGAKVLQRQSLARIKSAYGVRTTRLCYPPMCTTAIGAIPGGLLKFAASAELMLRAGTYKNLTELAADTIPAFRTEFTDDALYLDRAYKAVRREFDTFIADIDNDNLKDKLRTVVGYAKL